MRHYSVGGVQPQVTGDTGDTEIMDGVTTADLLKLIGGQPMVDEQAGSGEGKRPFTHLCHIFTP